MLAILVASQAIAFELLSEGAMGSVSAVSVNSVEELANIAGPAAAGISVDEDYEILPFEKDSALSGYETDDVSTELDFALTKEVESWANDVSSKQGEQIKVGFIEQLPLSPYDNETLSIVPGNEFENVIFDNDADNDDDTVYQIGRIEDTVTILESGVYSVKYIIERRVDYAATIDAFISDDRTPSLGSGYITDLRSISNVSIAQTRD